MIGTVAGALLKSTVSVGVNITDNVWVPTDSTVPAEGVYVKVPAMGDVAFSWVPLKAVPELIEVGADHKIDGMTWFTVSDTVLVALL